MQHALKLNNQNPAGEVVQNQDSGLESIGLKWYAWWRENKQYFHDRDHCTEPTLRSDMDSNMPERLFKP